MAAKKKNAAGAPQSAAAAAAAANEPPDHVRPQSPELGLTGDGVALPSIPALDEAVRDYVKFRDARIAKGLEEKKNKKLVLALMEKHNLGSYKVDDLVVVRKPKDETESIKVMAAADYSGDQPKGDAGEDDEE